MLYFIFQSMGMDALDAMSLATGTSLASMIPTAISSVRAHYRKGNVDSEILRAWWLFIFGGVL
ncbi:MAG: TSUP family transporter, partial [Halothiobacillus sp.]